ncbi:hypothetical protein B0H13DRAFT_1915676 [Mycena leptocephala]|nr:hypothetical protein B0H13DRAFT_1915676 [Mycena leptocephala]
MFYGTGTAPVARVPSNRGHGHRRQPYETLRVAGIVSRDLAGRGGQDGAEGERWAMYSFNAGDSGEGAGDAPKCTSWDYTGDSRSTGTKLSMDKPLDKPWDKRQEDGMAVLIGFRINFADTKLSARAERRKFNLLPPRFKTVSLASDKIK